MGISIFGRILRPASAPPSRGRGLATMAPSRWALCPPDTDEDRPIGALAWLALTAVAVITGASLLTGRRGLALGVLLMAASFSGLTAPFGTLEVRLEQPAVATLAVLVIIRERTLLRRFLTGARTPLTMFGLYVCVGLASSLIMSPDPAQSLKITAWLALSVIAAVVAGVLVAGGDGTDLGLSRWIVAGAIVQSGVAAMQVATELVLGNDWGVLRNDAPLGKAYGLSWEPNLLAISLAVALVFLIVPQLPSHAEGQGSSRGWRDVWLVVIALGLSLALSRGGIAGLVVALLIAAPAVVRSRRLIGGSAAIRDFAVRACIALAIAVAGYWSLGALANAGVGLRSGTAVVDDSGPLSSLIPAASPPGPSGIVSPNPAGPSPSASPASTATQPPSVSPPPLSPPPPQIGIEDTIELRIRNMQVAIGDTLRDSPVIGLGPDSFGLRYTEPTCRCPAHIPNLGAATIYESGLLGLAGLAAGLGLVIIGLWQAKGYAYLGALIVLITGYQFTDALRFGSNWVLIGVSIALTIAMRVPAGPVPRDTP